MKLAIVHDFLNQYGGAEKVVESLHEVFPDAPIFTSIFFPDQLPLVFGSMDVRTSFMQSLPGIRRHFKRYLPIYPRAIESFDLSGYDVVLSSSSAFAKGARPRNGAVHVCYCYTPMRFVWNPQPYLKNEEISPILRAILPPFLMRLKKWDLESVPRVTHFVAISDNVRKRIQAAYGRDSKIIYPPVDTKRFQISKTVGDYFLVVSRLNGYKRIDLAVAAFNELGLPLWIIGEGPKRRALEKAARPNIRFLGHIAQDKLDDVMSHCRAFIFPGEEDFGIAPVEAMACGRPVIAYAAGGALETVLEGETGLLFREPTVQSLIDTVRRFERWPFSSEAIRIHAEAFDKEIFKEKIADFISQKYSAAQTPAASPRGPAPFKP